jgi:signal transduction histidine kinase
MTPMLHEARTVCHLRYLAIAGPWVLLVVVEIAQRQLSPILAPWVLQFTVLAASLVVLAFFYDQIFGRLKKLERRLQQQNRELGATRERLRIAQEMHDGLAQVLAYVNTKAQVVREYLSQGKLAEAHEHLEEFAEAARGLYGDVRQQILDLNAVARDESSKEPVSR